MAATTQRSKNMDAFQTGGCAAAQQGLVNSPMAAAMPRIEGHGIKAFVPMANAWHGMMQASSSLEASALPRDTDTL